MMKKGETVTFTYPASPSRPAFITGSYAFGTPNAGSDIDFVVYANSRAREKLELAYCDGDENYDGGESIQFTLEGLNLIIVDANNYDAWRKGTEELCRRAGEGEVITRDEAKRVIREALVAMEKL